MISTAARKPAASVVRVAKSCLSRAALTEEFSSTAKTTPTPARAAESVSASLPNGARFVVNSQSSPITTVVIGVQGGSSAETVAQKGAAHLLSRVTFEGNAAKSAMRTTRELEDLGAVFGATADREAVVYTLRVPSAVLPEAMAKLADVVRTPIHRPYIVSENKDRAAIDYAPCGYKSIMELIHEAAYGENTPLGGSLYSGDLDALCPNEVIAYRNRVFTAGNLRVAVSGNASAKDLKALTESTLSTGFAEGANAAAKIEFVGGDARVRTSSYSRTRAAIAFKGSGKPQRVLSALLNERLATHGSHVQVHMHSSVHHYSNNSTITNTFFKSYGGNGLFGLVYKGDAAYVSAELQKSIGALKDIAAGKVSEEALTSAKNRVTFASKLARDENPAKALYESLVNGDSDVSAVSAADVTASAQAALKSLPAYAVYGTTYQVPSFTQVNKWLA